MTLLSFKLCGLAFFKFNKSESLMILLCLQTATGYMSSGSQLTLSIVLIQVFQIKNTATSTKKLEL